MRGLVQDSDSKKKASDPQFMLSEREKEILALIAEEFTTQEIAQKLHLSFKTVEGHRRNLFSKLNVRNAAGLVRVALENNLLNV
jgi:DNA-binding NarL/FixJ family response regulator